MIDGVIDAWRLDSRGGAVWVGEDIAAAIASPEATVWLHLDRSADGIDRFLKETLGVEPLIANALLAADTRPRCESYDDGLLINLRGVNLNPGANPEDMLSLRMWVTGHLIVSLRKAKLMSVDDIRQRLKRGAGPKNASEVVTDLALALSERMGPVILGMHDRLDGLEEAAVLESGQQSRADLSDARRQIIALRRFIAPQQIALSHLSTAEVTWFAERQRIRSREALDAVTRYVEDLDSLRDKAGVIRDEISNAVSERLNRNMYVLAIISVIFIPLSFFTGLLGINVGGIPGTESSTAFLIVCLLLIVGAVLEIFVLRWRRWF
ncbi:MAG: zinc transporter ZntB [Rhodospirillales bacterium]